MKNIWTDGIMGVVIGDALGMPVQFMEQLLVDWQHCIMDITVSRKGGKI